jgi:catechol 2,3-dioxygenase
MASMAVSPRTDSRPGAIDPGTAIGAVSLTVADLGRSLQFYERAIGLRASELADGSVALAASGGPPLVILHGDAGAPRRDPHATGLFHQAILVPTRRDLAMALARVADAGWPLDGASDHLVSEALYLSDPDGNGIEIYRDRPRQEWSYRDGTLQMSTLRLDLQSVLSEIAGVNGLEQDAPAGTTIGHVHLQVAELAEIEHFYGDVIGLDVMVRGYPGALFMSAGGYHHHLGLNTWHSADGPRPVPGAIGLRRYELAVPSEAERERIIARAAAAGVPVEDGGSASVGESHVPVLRDPSGNAVGLIVRAR